MARELGRLIGTARSVEQRDWSAAAAVARGLVVAAARRLITAGLCVGNSGNVSLRFEGRFIAITPAGIPYEEMDAEDIVVVDAAGTVVNGHRRASSETGMHLAIYAARADVGAIVHTHSSFATAFAIAGRPIPAVHYVIAPLGDEIRVAPYATFGTAALARGVATTLGADNAVLIGNHGAVAVGPDLRTAFERAERVEELAALAWRAAALGGPVILDRPELERVRAQWRRISGVRKPPGP